MVWTRASLCMAVVGGGWLVILPLLFLRLEQGRFAVPLRNGLFVGIGLVTFLTGMLLALVSGVYLIFNGGGTPLPLDPPQRLVTAGPYAYVRIVIR